MGAPCDSQNSVGAVSPGRQRQLDAIRPHQWKPGESGNPGGRPKSLMKQVREELSFEDAARVVAEMVKDKHPVIVKEYMAREWPVTQKHELSGPDGGPIAAQAKPVDLSVLSDEERDQLRAITRKLMTPPRPELED